jgi:prophage maintenance system killer protein
MSEIVLFQDDSGNTNVNVRLDGDTVWLTQQQMADLFHSTRTNITHHLANIYSDGELEEKATCEEFSQVRIEGSRTVSRDLPHYNLDAIISVGYRVNSKQGVAFRKWATNVLNEHLVHGFTLNQNRLADLGITEAQHVVDLLARALEKQPGLTDESLQIVNLVKDYAKTWKTLLQYDENSLAIPSGEPSIGVLDYITSISDINTLKTDLIEKGEATPLFGQERGETFQGLLGNIEQTMFGEPLYKSREEKAANLLYFIIKDHPFSDGNKRIGSFMFLRYVKQEQIKADINPDTMSALALLIAESDPTNKDMMIRFTMNVITPLSQDVVKNEPDESDIVGNKFG